MILLFRMEVQVFRFFSPSQTRSHAQSSLQNKGRVLWNKERNVIGAKGESKTINNQMLVKCLRKKGVKE